MKCVETINNKTDKDPSWCVDINDADDNNHSSVSLGDHFNENTATEAKKTVSAKICKGITY